MRKCFISRILAIILIISLLPAASFGAPWPVSHDLNGKANRMSNVKTNFTQANSASMVDISGKVKAEYKVADVFSAILKIYPEILPDIIEMVLPQNLVRRDIIVEKVSNLDGEEFIEYAERLGLLDMLLENFNPQKIIDLIPNIADEIKNLLIKIVPSSISNQIALPGTVITVRDEEGRVVTMKIADIKGSYKLNVPVNYEVEYKLAGFETLKRRASTVSDTIHLIPSAGTAKGMVIGENNKPLEGTKVTIITAEGKPFAFTDAKGKYEIKNINPLLPGLAGGIGAHTVLFDKVNHSLAKATTIFGFGQAVIVKKLDLAPLFGNLEGFIDTSIKGAWLLSGGITVKVYDSNDRLVKTEKITAKIPDDINNLKYNFVDLPVGKYTVEFSAKLSLLSKPIVQTVSGVVIKAGRTTTLDQIIGN